MVSLATTYVKDCKISPISIPTFTGAVQTANMGVPEWQQRKKGEGEGKQW